MNVYIWTYVSPATTEYHDGGAVLIVAKSLHDARSLWRIEMAHIDGCDNTLVGEPDRILPTTSDEPLVMVFADSGCC